MIMARKKIIAGNWKMNMTPSQAVELINTLKPLVANDEVDVLLCVPAIDIIPAMEAAKGSNIMIGATSGTGLAKCPHQCFTPFLWIPLYSISSILIIASPAVMFKSFVGGLNPKSPIRFAHARYSATVINQGM